MTEYMCLNEEEQSLFTLLVKDIGVSPDATKTAKLMGVSKAALYRMRKQGIGPKYLQNTNSSTIHYPLHEIVRYLCNTQKAEEATDEKC